MYKPNRRTAPDSGMTLVELLASVAVIGAIVTVLAAAVTVTFRQQGTTEARLDVARWEQSLALWLPSDLASAADITADPHAAPCGSEACTFGSNALQLTWNDGSGPTNVSYRYGPAADGTSYQLTRVKCHAGPCTSQIVLRDLSGPVDDLGAPVAWVAGSAVPDSVIDVTVPVDALEVDPENPVLDAETRAQRVIVNVNGAPGSDGVVRNSTVSFSAGGAVLRELDPVTYEGPSFLQANSACGGPITLIVDESGSVAIAGGDDDVRSGVRSFIEAFEGTPTKLQIITFGTTSSTLQPSSAGDWNHFFDLSEPSEVTTLLGPTGHENEGLVETIRPRTGAGGGTNWEDALRRAYYGRDGQTYAQIGSPIAPTPEMVVFFTDGEPTYDRQHARTGTANPSPASIPSKFNYETAGNTSYGGEFSPRAVRADAIVDQFRDIRLIGVGVGTKFNQSTTVNRNGWPTSGGNYRPIPNRNFLGDLVAGGDPSTYDPINPPSYVTRTYDSTTGWGDVASADLLVTDNFLQFGSALGAIALEECGGTLTVQTRDHAGHPANASVTYQVDDKVVTTTRDLEGRHFRHPTRRRGVESGRTRAAVARRERHHRTELGLQIQRRRPACERVPLDRGRQSGGRRRGHRDQQCGGVVHDDGDGMSTVQRRTPGPARDRGSVLPLVLVMIVVAGLIVVPMLSYAVSIFRANSVVSTRTRDLESAKGGLRVALADPANIFTTCDNSGSLPATTVNGLTVTTTCTELAEIGPATALGYQLPTSAVATQLGATVPSSFSGTRGEPPAVPPYVAPDWWAGQTSDIAPVNDAIWMPQLPRYPSSDRVATPFNMPSSFDAGSIRCKVFLPGRYSSPLTLDQNWNYYFASGVYYFSQPIRVSGAANVVVGYGLSDFDNTDCADDIQVAANVQSPPATFDINGGGATFVFGANAQLVIDDSNGPRPVPGCGSTSDTPVPTRAAGSRS